MIQPPSTRFDPIVWMRFSSILLIMWGGMAGSASAEEDPLIEGTWYAPECLDVRGHDHECVRDRQGAPWRCTDQAHLDLRVPDFGVCLMNAKDTRPVCACGKQCGPRFRQLPSMTTTDPATGATKTTCDLSPLKRERETAPAMSAKYTEAVSFALPKEKFPQCLAARTQTHECMRASEDSDWKCERRPRLRDPIALCLVWSNWYHPCRTNPQWPIIGYVTTNINPTSHAVEPVLRCIYDHSGFQTTEDEIRPAFPPIGTSRLNTSMIPEGGVA